MNDGAESDDAGSGQMAERSAVNQQPLRIQGIAQRGDGGQRQAVATEQGLDDVMYAGAVAAAEAVEGLFR